MKQFVSLVLAIGISFSAIGRISAQTPQDQDEVVRFRTNEVKLDIVVKDKKGRPVKDLTAADFEILEDGVAQKIQSFTFVNREATLRTPETANTGTKEGQPQPVTTTTAPASVRTTPGVTALVFDRLSPGRYR